MRRLLALLALVVAAAAACDFADDAPVLIDREYRAYQFSLRNANGTRLTAFPAGGRGRLQVSFTSPVDGFSIACSLHAKKAQFWSYEFAAQFSIDLPPPNVTADWDLCTMIFSQLAPTRVLLTLDAGCPGSSLPIPTPTPSPTPTPAAGTPKRHSIVYALLHLPSWIYVTCGVIASSLIIFIIAACNCCARSQHSDLRADYTRLDDPDADAPPSPPPEGTLPESLAPRRLLLPFRAFLGLRCGSLFCLVLSARADDDEEARAHL